MTDELVMKDVAAETDPRVAAALQKLAASAGVDLGETPDVLDDVYRRLQAVLSDPGRR